MATIIDALIVELGLDTSKFNASQKTAVRQLGDLEKAGDKTEKSTKKVSKASKEAAHNVDNLSRTIGSFLAIIGGTVALKNFISDFIEGNAALDRLSKNLGLSVPTISAWSNATEKLGGSAQALQGTLDMLSKSQTQLMITGESNLLPYMSALGISLADVNGKARPVDDILLDLSDRFSRLDRTTANNLGRMMGLDQGTMNLLLQGRKELEIEIARQKEQTAVTKEQAAQAQKFQTQVAGLKQQFQAFGRSLFMEAAPYLEKFFNILQNFATWIGGHEQFMKDFLTVLAVGLGAIALITAPINLTVAAVVALAGAIALLWDDYQTWKKGGDSLIDWGKWKPGIDAATWGLHQLNEEIKAFTKGAQFLHDLIPDSAARLLQRGVAALGYRPAEDEIAGKRGNGSRADSFVAGLHSGAPAAGGSSSLSDRARAIAKQVSAQTGISEDVLFAAFAHETGNFTNRGARTLNNFAGVNVPGGKGEDYRTFASDQEFANYYAGLMKSLYPGTLGAQNPDAFASGLKNGVNGRQYFSDSQANYANGIRSHLGSGYASSVAGIPGAASIVSNAPGRASGGASTSIDKSVQTQIGTITINTQATDADGIARDAYHSFDYLFASQANTGMN
jgi:hypothetical protein